MSTTEVLEPTVAAPKPSTGQQAYKHSSKSGGNNNNFKRKNKYDRGNRKRSKSFNGGMNNAKPVLPSKFLLGGNIKDPLNLNSLQDEEINRAMNAVTPKSSPVPTPPRKKGQLDVLIPKNIHDPLHLIDCEDDVMYEQQLNSPLKKSKKKRLKKRRTLSSSAALDSETVVTSSDLTAPPEAKTPENSTDSAKVPEVPDNAPKSSIPRRDLSIELGAKKEPKKRKSDDHAGIAKKFKNSMDKIVSPVVPQPGGWLKRTNSIIKLKPKQNKNVDKLPQFKDKNKRFQYGNYNRYYGYRIPHSAVDGRLNLFLCHGDLFENKDILDVGCNIGHITLSLARDFRPRSILGIDIDAKLISIARNNVKYYAKTEVSPPQGEGPSTGTKRISNFYPVSLPMVYGAIDIPDFPSVTEDGRTRFPHNVTFKQCNYILEDDNLLNIEQPQYDVILCLSVTKWIQLNWGDAGLKQAFRRMYAQLRPGGKLILEPQHWSSYKSKKKLTETIYRNYNTIEFFPDKFRDYLLSSAVGFAKSEVLGCPANQSKGFRRPILVFTKSSLFPSERTEATPVSYTPTVSGDSGRTDKYEAKSQISVEHVYTDLYSRYCGSLDDSAEINDKIGEELENGELEDDVPFVGPVSDFTDDTLDQARTDNLEFGESAERTLDHEGKFDGDGGAVIIDNPGDVNQTSEASSEIVDNPEGTVDCPAGVDCHNQNYRNKDKT